MGPEEAAEVSGAGGLFEDHTADTDNDTDITGDLMEEEAVEGIQADFSVGVSDGGWGDASMQGDVGVDGVLHALRTSLTRLPSSPHSLH